MGKIEVTQDLRDQLMESTSWKDCGLKNKTAQEGKVNEEVEEAEVVEEEVAEEDEKEVSALTDILEALDDDQLMELVNLVTEAIDEASEEETEEETEEDEE